MITKEQIKEIQNKAVNDSLCREIDQRLELIKSHTNCVSQSMRKDGKKEDFKLGLDSILEIVKDIRFISTERNKFIISSRE